MKILENIDSIQKGNVILLFTTDWCGDCIILSFYIDNVVEKYPEITFLKVNSDNYQTLAREYNVFGIPSFVALKDGNVIGEYIDKNAKPQDKIEAWINKLNF